MSDKDIWPLDGIARINSVDLCYAPAGIKPDGDYAIIQMNADGNICAVLTDEEKDDIARRVVEQLRPLLEMETGIKDE